jgi:hypothetical protein
VADVAALFLIGIALTPRIVFVFPAVEQYLARAADTPEAARTELYFSLVLEPHLNDCFSFPSFHPSHSDLVGMTSGNPAGWNFPAARREIETLKANRRELQSSIRSALTAAERQLPGHSPGTVCVLYYEPTNPVRAPMNGVMAYTPSENILDLYVAPVPGWKDWVAYNLAHESHHADWMHLHPGADVFGFTLTDYLVFEGRADQFAHAITGLDGAWTHALSKPEECRWMKAIRPHLAETGPLLPQVMFGRGGTYPRWTGYTLGYGIVGAFLARHPGMKPAEWTAMDAKRLFDESGFAPCER